VRRHWRPGSACASLRGFWRRGPFFVFFPKLHRDDCCEIAVLRCRGVARSFHPEPLREAAADHRAGVAESLAQHFLDQDFQSGAVRVAMERVGQGCFNAAGAGNIQNRGSFSIRRYRARPCGRRRRGTAEISQVPADQHRWTTDRSPDGPGKGLDHATIPGEGESAAAVPSPAGFAQASAPENDRHARAIRAVAGPRDGFSPRARSHRGPPSAGRAQEGVPDPSCTSTPRAQQREARIGRPGGPRAVPWSDDAANPQTFGVRRIEEAGLGKLGCISTSPGAGCPARRARDCVMVCASVSVATKELQNRPVGIQDHHQADLGKVVHLGEAFAAHRNSRRAAI